MSVMYRCGMQDTSERANIDTASKRVLRVIFFEVNSFICVILNTYFGKGSQNVMKMPIFLLEFVIYVCLGVEKCVLDCSCWPLLEHF